MVIHVAGFSGGKDSTALLLWLRERGLDYRAVFCDTAWEHPMTYAYIEEINQTILGGRLVVLRSEGMEALVARKKRVPSIKARFCTEHLKVLPMIAYLKSLDDDVTYYQGIRAEESAARAGLSERQWSDDFDCWIERPLLRWSAEQVFAFLAQHHVAPNPLYFLGAGRVGCFPCVLITHGELRRLTITAPEVWDQIERLEAIAGRTFFPPQYIPDRFCTGFDPKSGKPFPTAADVRTYLKTADQGDLFQAEPPRCMSIYNLCE